MNVRIAIFGAGGVGGYFGGRLAQAGQDVIFIARGAHLQAIRRNGLRVESIKGDFCVEQVQATDDPREVGTVDAILVCVKSWQVVEAARAMHPILGPATFVVPMQNGIEAPNQLATELGHTRVLGGLCGIIAYRSEPGHIRHIGVDPFVSFNELDNSPSERTERLRQAFERSRGLSVTVPLNIEAAMWEKFLFITAISGLGAVTRMPVGVVRRQPGTRRLLECAMEEIHTVARAHRISLPSDIVTTTMGFIDALPEDATASMQRDVLERRASELEAQNGAVVRLGAQAGIATPVNGFIYHCLLALERRARGEETG
ncbi:2-dehydropantoate 2-reductase [Nitrococcus mobilis Nb-231]|uniref:2-dehydropantoate 2-reductase n=1 Tax=Nitrococcus mobilis Nb-231 TaxID=314278 RepID=A4BT92_9GAMM|nr:2-dehydropantoate 2-reductase [Nitrococcus mobilis Nb-231]